jgi:hypothetical protein
MADFPQPSELYMVMVELTNKRSLIGGVTLDQQALALTNPTKTEPIVWLRLWHPVDVFVDRFQGPPGFGGPQPFMRSPNPMMNSQAPSNFSVSYVYLPHCQYAAPRLPYLDVKFDTITSWCPYPLAKDDRLKALYDTELGPTPQLVPVPVTPPQT